MESVKLQGVEEDEIAGIRSRYPTAKVGGYPYREYWSLFILCFCVGLILLAVFLGSFGLGKANRIQAQIEGEMTLRQEIAQQQSEVLPFGTKSIALSSVYKSGKPRILSLCNLASYHARSDAPLGEPLLSLNETIDELIALKNHVFYHLKAHLRLTFTELTKKKKLKTTGVLMEEKKKAILLEFNLSSNFQRFSTVKLQELEFDTHERSLSSLRQVVLCSNSPFAIAQRCDLSKEGLKISGEEELSFDIPSLEDSTRKRKQPDDDKEDKDEEDDEEDKEIEGIRIYNLVFYQSIGTGSNTTTVKERKIMTLEPTKC